jgi:hypothetical protein
VIGNDVALALVVLKVLGEQVKTGESAAKREVAGAALPGDRTTAVLPDGTPVGTVGQAKGRINARVTDREKFTAFVQDAYPGEVELVPTVRPAFEKRVLDACKANKAPVDANGAEVPGVEVGVGDPYTTVKLGEDAHELVAAAYQSGQLEELMERYTRPAIEAGGQS